MAVYSVGLITFVFAVVFLDGIESRPQPAVHHYRYKIEDGGGDAGGEGGADFGGNPGGAFFQYKTSNTACGLGNIADEIAEGIDTGKVPQEVKSIAREFFGGLGNIGRDITSAFSQAAISLASDVSNLG